MELDFSKQGGLIPVVVQDATSGEVLRVGFMNAEALAATLETGAAALYSRSRQKPWRKGEQSGHRLRAREWRAACDADSRPGRLEPMAPGVGHDGIRGW